MAGKIIGADIFLTHQYTVNSFSTFRHSKGGYSKNLQVNYKKEKERRLMLSNTSRNNIPTNYRVKWLCVLAMTTGASGPATK
jgi:hypothetical protein